MCRRVSRLLEFWFSNQLLPSLEQGTVIVMDNASFHSNKLLIIVLTISQSCFSTVYFGGSISRVSPAAWKPAHGVPASL